jgi:hypothetical protein
MGLFAGVQFQNRWTAYLVPIMGLFMSDCILGFHSPMPIIYGLFILSVELGTAVQVRRFGTLGLTGVTLVNSTLFFFIGFAQWRRTDPKVFLRLKTIANRL